MNPASSFSVLMAHKEMVSHETQTDDAEVKQFETIDTQTDIKETIEAKCQTDRADQCNTGSQTKILEYNEEEAQTERNVHSQECQASLPTTEIECQTSLFDTESECETPTET